MEQYFFLSYRSEKIHELSTRRSEDLISPTKISPVETRKYIFCSFNLLKLPVNIDMISITAVIYVVKI